MKITVEFSTKVKEHTDFSIVYDEDGEEVELESTLYLEIVAKYYTHVKEEGKPFKKVCIGRNIIEVFDSIVNPFIKNLYHFNYLASIAQSELSIYSEEHSVNIAVLREQQLNINRDYATPELLEQIIQQIEDYLFVVIKTPVLLFPTVHEFLDDEEDDEQPRNDLEAVYQKRGYGALFDGYKDGQFNDADAFYKYQSDYLKERIEKIKTM